MIATKYLSIFKFSTGLQQDPVKAIDFYHTLIHGKNSENLFYNGHKADLKTYVRTHDRYEKLPAKQGASSMLCCG